MELKEIINKVLELKVFAFSVYDFRNVSTSESTNYYVQFAEGGCLFNIHDGYISVIFLNRYSPSSLSLLKELKVKFTNHIINQKVI